MFEQGFNDKAVPDCVNGRDRDLVEVSLCLLEGGFKLTFPRDEVALVKLNKILEDRGGRRIDSVDIAQDVVDLLAASLVDGRADGPDERKYEPLLSVAVVFFFAFILTLDDQVGDRVVQCAHVLDAGTLTGWHELAALHALDLEHFWKVFLD